MAMAESQTFERKVLETENKNLTYYTEKTNKEAIQQKTENLFINLSIKEILINLSKTFVGILNDLLTPGNLSLTGGRIIDILFKEDRMIYVGLLILFISFSIYLIDITS
jgi:hypothetical protein